MGYQNGHNGKPEGSPSCWGWAGKYQDGDQECIQCPFREGCRPVALTYLTQNPASPLYGVPVLPPMPTPQQPPPQPTIPLPQKPFVPFYPQQVAQAPNPMQLYRPQVPQSPQIPQLPPMATPTYPYQTPQASSQALDTKNPHPLAAMYRPGVPAPPYYFSMYPGETVKTRLGKNVIMRIIEAFLSELALFARHWTWPPKP